MQKTPSSLDTCEISPVRPNNKHQATPNRLKRKTSRRDQCIDVHNSSTPTQSPGLVNRSLSSPSSSFPYSQENCPDVVWDYTSPKLPRGARKKEIKLTVKELLDNLNQCQVPESNTQSAQYIKLLENYMAKQTVPANVRKTGRNIRNKKRPHAFEELQKFLETIPRQKKDTETNSRPPDNIETKDPSNAANTSKLNISAKSFIDGDSSECDSTDELWGEADYSFIIKATQELESLQPNLSQDVISTIPESCPSPKTPVRKPNHRRSTEKVSVDVETYNDLLEQLTNVDWDSVDYDEWDNGFIEDDALSMIPEDVLNGNDETLATNAANIEVENSTKLPNDANFEKNVQIQSNGANSKNIPSTKSNVEVGSSSNGTNVARSGESSSGTFSGDTVIYSLKGVEDEFENGGVFNSELFNSFEDESFEDESLLCQPDVLSRIDEVESMMSQLPKCTPEEIEKKKDEALKRRQKRP